MKFPPWFKQEIPDSATLEKARLLSESGVHTVCQEARCPNLSYCFKHSDLTFMLLGDTCTRNCRFCAVKKSQSEEKIELDLDEPLRITEAVRKLGLNYVVITSVTRDDLADGGAEIFTQTIALIRNLNSDIKIEILIPDFQGKRLSLQSLLASEPDVVAHNLETVPRFYPHLRPMADYALSLSVLRTVKELNPEIITKSSLMLGLGEAEEEVIAAMHDLRRNYCDILTLGQYLSPSLSHYSAKEFVAPEHFQKYQKLGLELGFKAVSSGPLVRSSYRARELYEEFVHV